MRLRRVFTRLFCIPFTFASMFIVVASSATFASTAGQPVDVSHCVELSKGIKDVQPGQGPVSLLQKDLKDKGQNLGTSGTAKDGVDGQFGSMTEQAVMNYQKANNLTPDGFVGKDTWTALGGCDTTAKSGQTSTGNPSNPSQTPVLCTVENLNNSNSKLTDISPKDPKAGPATYTVLVNNKGAKACATFTFSKTDNTVITGITLAVIDTASDNHSASIQLRIHDSRTAAAGTTNDQLNNTASGGTGSMAQSRLNDSYTNNVTGGGARGGTVTTKLPITGVEVKVCSDTCTFSKNISNPY